MKNYLFDSDGTLINSIALRPYWSSMAGFAYVAENASKLQHNLFDKRSVPLVLGLHKQGRAAITTNAPYAYARALLSSHGFPSDIPIYSALGKPSTLKLKHYLIENKINPEESLIIGDTPHDVIAARRLHSFSAGVLWGRTNKERMEKAHPTAMAENHEELEMIIDNFEHNKLPVKYIISHWKNYDKLSENSPFVDIEYSTLGNYFSSKSKKMDEHSGKILDFKKSKEFYIDEIIKGATADYTWKGNIIAGRKISDVISDFHVNLLAKLRDAQDCVFAAAPNSFPAYFYQTDINQLIVDKLNDDFKTGAGKERIFSRVFATEATHLGGSGSEKTIGIRKDANLNYQNIIIFDDIVTTGRQTQSLAKLLRQRKFEGKIRCISLGKTSHQ